MMSDGYEYLRETCPLLQTELLEAVALVDEEAGVGVPTVVNRRPGIWVPVVDGSDANGRRVRQRM
jgi:speckle-type POZ protein